MDKEQYIKEISTIYQCNLNLAEKIYESAKLNGRNIELSENLNFKDKIQ